MIIKIDKEWKFWIYVVFELFISICVLVIICLVGYYILLSQNIAYNHLSKSCNNMFGEGNWTIQDTRVRSNWYSIGQEFTCVQNGTEKYYNEILKDKNVKTR